MKRLFQVILLIMVFSLASCAAHYKDRPHGWDHGKKKGWGGGDVPPGHQKKGHHKKHDDGDEIDININVDIDGDDDDDHDEKYKYKKRGKGH